MPHLFKIGLTILDIYGILLKLKEFIVKKQETVFKIKALLRELNVMTVIKVFFMAFTCIYVMDISTSLKVQRANHCLELKERIAQNPQVSDKIKEQYVNYCEGLE